MSRDPVAEICTRFLAGESVQHLADEYMVHRDWVEGVLRLWSRKVRR